MHYAGIPPDFYERIEIYPASVSITELFARGPRIIRLNAV